jgi:hypothetical protein
MFHSDSIFMENQIFKGQILLQEVIEFEERF